MFIQIPPTAPSSTPKKTHNQGLLPCSFLFCILLEGTFLNLNVCTAPYV
uniref:Uncharacterized protein n=1 Tax=Anguilla anguilla TaxID=7936 RepID=A0A0E9TNW5_ANGAN